MDVREFLGSLEGRVLQAGELAHIHELPERHAEYRSLSSPLATPLPDLLQEQGLDQLYTHQCHSIELARDDENVVVVTGTASGKTLCYNLPVLESLLQDPESCAIYLFPTKALCQDQLGTFQELTTADRELNHTVRAAIYDGDTPSTNRQKIKSHANVIMTNPDMLHVGILPYHAKWSRVLENLKYIVIDEIHMYRGIFGGNVACLLRRLNRICDHYGARPRFICASATVANPAELAEHLTGQNVTVVDQDGSPRGKRFFLMVNPSYLAGDSVSRSSAADISTLLMSELVNYGAQTITFTRTRLAAELIYRYVRDLLQRRNSPAADQVRAYRGGYLPNERRAIERELFQGAIRGVVSTNALELGIDVGSLDAAIMVGYPGTIASTWQQAGRAGRRSDASLAVLVAHNDPIDQYLMRHPEYFFGQSPEHAVIDPENPYILQNHLRAAAYELPLTEADTESFGALAPPLADALCEEELLNQVDGCFYSTTSRTPALEFSLRHMSDNTFAIIQESPAHPGRPDVHNGFRSPKSARAHSMEWTGRQPSQLPEGYKVIANVDAISAPELVYPEAIYLHNAETYLVRELDLEGKLAYVERREVDYYTQAILESSVQVEQQREQRLWQQAVSLEQPLEDHSETTVCFGDMDVTWKTVCFKKIKFETRENLGMGPVDIPAQTLPTTGFWIVPSTEIKRRLKEQKVKPSEGLVGVRNLMIQALPILAMCDPRDISGVTNSSNLGTAAVFLYDRYPGGLGYCEKGYHQTEELVGMCLQMVSECECDGGCPSCVGLPNLRPAIHSDPDLSRGFPIPDKRGAELILTLLAEKNSVDSAKLQVESNVD